MGSKNHKTSIERITCPMKRNMTLWKRKKGLLKKAIELASMCNTKVYLAIYDDNRKRFTEYQSAVDFNLDAISAYQSGQNCRVRDHEVITNGDYHNLKYAEKKRDRVRAAQMS